MSIIEAPEQYDCRSGDGCTIYEGCYVTFRDERYEIIKVLKVKRTLAANGNYVLILKPVGGGQSIKVSPSEVTS